MPGSRSRVYAAALLNLCLSFSDNGAGCCSTQLIDGDGAFNVAGIGSFLKEQKLAECGLSYAIVSIMGPQSSGMHY